MTERYTCSKCTMGFRVGPPKHPDTEVSSCPDCGLRFWHQYNSRETGNKASVVGVFAYRSTGQAICLSA